MWRTVVAVVCTALFSYLFYRAHQEIVAAERERDQHQETPIQIWINSNGVMMPTVDGRVFVHPSADFGLMYVDPESGRVYFDQSALALIEEGELLLIAPLPGRVISRGVEMARLIEQSAP